jgi:hypothetical protein
MIFIISNIIFLWQGLKKQAKRHKKQNKIDEIPETNL